MSRRLDAATVIVPTLGRPILESTLAALAAGEVVPSALVVADQSPAGVDASWLQRVRDAGVEVTHLRFPPAGPAAARNRAIDWVTTPWLAAVDDDCVPSADWLARLVDRLDDHAKAIVTGRVAAPDASGEARSTPSLLEVPIEQIHRRPTTGPDPLHTGNFGVALDVARRIGPFDESLDAAEDNDWGWRALRLGVPIVTAPEVVVVHDDHRDAVEREAVERRYALGQGRFYGKHLRRGDLLIARRAVRDGLRGPMRWLRGWLTGDRSTRTSGRIWTVEMPRGVCSGLVRPGEVGS